MTRKISQRELAFIRADETRRERERERVSSALFSEAKRSHAVERVKDILRRWRLSPFEHEGACRAGLRSSLCLQGVAWGTADGEAALIVHSALNLLGAQRPTFDEAQPSWTDSPDYCSWCRGPVEEKVTGKKHRFCSIHCARQSRNHRSFGKVEQQGEYYNAARIFLQRDAVPAKPCAYCGTAFKGTSPGVRYCSQQCFHLDRYGDGFTKPITCEQCGTSFMAQNRQRARYCGLRCSGIANGEAQRIKLAQTERSCEHCQKPFVPTSPVNCYCGPECRKRALRMIENTGRLVARAQEKGRKLDFTPRLFDYLVKIAA